MDKFLQFLGNIGDTFRGLLELWGGLAFLGHAVLFGWRRLRGKAPLAAAAAVTAATAATAATATATAATASPEYRPPAIPQPPAALPAPAPPPMAKPMSHRETPVTSYPPVTPYPQAARPAVPTRGIKRIKRPWLSLVAGVSSILYLGGFLLALASTPTSPDPTTGTYVYGPAFGIGIITMVLGFLLALTAVIWGIVSALRARQWGWAVGILLGAIGTSFLFLPGLLPLLYAILAPTGVRTPNPVPVMAGR
ncbi:MAG: hypothetical protein OJF49_004254 [Ktedonobacterales bacterium]|nr:MAG: hypothetical protein OJF49_004254 [Ktedonobacterales bacterium]